MRIASDGAAFCCAALLSCLSASAAFAQTASAPPVALAPVTVDRTTVAWSSADGMTVAVDGVAVVRKSTLFVVKKGWTGTLLDQRAVTPKVEGWNTAADGSRTARVTVENDVASCTYTLSLDREGAADRVTVDLAYRLKRDVPAEIEYAAGYLSGPVLQGATLSGPVGSPVATRVVPVAPPPRANSQEQNRLCPPFTEATLATRLGPMTLSYDGDAPPPVLFDARSDPQAWAAAFPVFWLGIGSPAPPVTLADGERHARFRFTFAPPAAPTRAIATATGLAVTRSPLRPDAYAPPSPPATPLVLPRPKRATFPAGAAPFRLTAKTRIVPCDATDGTRRAVAVLRSAIQARFGFTPTVQLMAAPKALFVGVAGKSPILDRRDLGPAARAEGYSVRVAPDVVLVSGSDEAGVLWGAQTLVQLLAADRDGPFAPLAQIEDWPTLPLRAVHLFHGKEALPFHEKLIDRLFSPFKLNALFLQAEQVRWDHDPQVAPTWAGTKDQIRAEIAFAREHGLAVYPLVRSYGHMEWLFTQDANRAYAKYLEGFEDEANRLFGASGFHIGLDEVTMEGRFPYRSQPRSLPDLFVSAARHWHDYFAARGKRTWMWADMALHPSEIAPDGGSAPTATDAAAIRAGLPKDIVLVDWQYTASDRYPSLKLLKDAGFKDVVAATWYDPADIQNFSRAAAQAGALGAMQTTWCGYESKEDVLDTPERRQFTAMILAADYFWNGGAGPAPGALPYDPTVVFDRLWAGPTPEQAHPRRGYTLRLAGTGVRPTTNWLDYGTEDSPTGLPPTDTRFGDGTIYHTGDGPLLLAGKLNPPGDFPLAAELPSLRGATAKPRTVRLLIAASHETIEGTPIGSVRVRTSDGKTRDIPLLYGKNVAAWSDPRGASGAPVVWKGSTRNGQPVYLRRLEVIVEAGKAIDAVIVSSANIEAAPAVFAVTFLE